MMRAIKKSEVMANVMQLFSDQDLFYYIDQQPANRLYKCATCDKVHFLLVECAGRYYCEEHYPILGFGDKHG